MKDLQQFCNVKAQIDLAFDRGKARPITEVVMPYHLPEDDERLQLFRDFDQRRWWEVPIEVVYLHKDAIPLLSNKGFKLCIPAFLSASLDLKRDGAETLQGFCVMSLVPIVRNGVPLKSKIEKFDQLSSAQKRAITGYLMLFSGLHDLLGEESRKALAMYWETDQNTTS